MRKLIVCAMLLGVMSLFAGGAPNALLAQGKKDAKKDTKKAAKAGVIEIGEGKDGKFRFFVRNSEGKLLAMSGPTGFADKKAAEKAIEELKEVIADAKVVAKKAADDDDDKGKNKDKDKSIKDKDKK